MLPYHFEQFLDAFNEAVCISDKNGIIVHINAKHSELTGLPRDEVIGKSVLDLVNLGHFDVVLNPSIIKEKQPVTRVQSLENGTKVVLDGHPIFNADGEVALVVTFIRDVTTLHELKEQITAQKELLETFRNLQDPEAEKIKHGPRVVHSRAMKKVFGQMGIIAATDATVLLLGDTGVGKDVFARRIHATSPRADRPFIKADCGSMPENLIETELFGYAPGTFSGGNKQGKAGLIEAAHTGTLFLDEIGELPMSMQSRLLRLLQDWEVMRVGSTVSQKVDVRIIAATNKDLELAVEQGRFRSDLYYRLKVAVIRIPTLAKRKADILPLAHCFLDFYCYKYRRAMKLSPAAETVLTEYEWPGNVRELENLIHGLVVTTGKALIEPRDLPIARSTNRKADPESSMIQGMDIEGKTYKDILRELETSVIQTGLRKYGSITEVAKHFKVDRTTIFRKVKEMEKNAVFAAAKV